LIKVEKADFSGNENDFYFETEGVTVYGPAHVTFTIDFFWQIGVTSSFLGEPKLLRKKCLTK
jgi:hypothetical protein